MERVKFIDIAKGIGIMLMVLCHTGFTNVPSIQIIYAFHMPLFFIISGHLTYGRTKQCPLESFCQRNFINSLCHSYCLLPLCPSLVMGSKAGYIYSMEVEML